MSYALIRVGKVWHYRFQMDGKRIQKTTRETSRKQADAVAEKAYTKARLNARGEEPVPTVRELAAKWVEVHAQTVSPAHVRSVGTFVRMHLYDLADLLLTEVTTGMVEVLRSKMLEEYAPATVNHWQRTLLLLFNWAMRRHMIHVIPWKLKMLKLQKRPRAVLPTAKVVEWIAVIDEAAGARRGLAIAIRMMFGLGLREGEALGARWEWLDWERKQYTPGKTKGREADPVPVPGWLIELLQAQRKPTGFIAVDAGRVSPYSPGTARRIMDKANKVCGTAGITPHRLRGTFATLLSEEGVPIQDIQRVLRHKDPKTTMAYLEVNMGIAAKAQTAIAGKIGFGKLIIINERNKNE